MRKIIKSANTRQANTFRLHYFPNIPARTERLPDAGSENAAFKAPPGPPDPGTSADGQVRPDVGQAQGPPNPSMTDRDQLEAMAKQAYAEGFAQGEHDAKALAEQRIAPLMTTLENVLTELTGTRQKLQGQIENEVVDLALHIGRKIVGKALQTNRDAVADIVHEALKHVDDPQKICIRLNPADVQHLRSAPGLGNLGAADRIRLEEDSTIDAGGCLVQTEYGEIDARIEEQFRTIEEAFRAETMGLATED